MSVFHTTNMPYRVRLNKFCVMASYRHAAEFQRKRCYEAMVTDKELLFASLQPLLPKFLRLAPPLLPCPQVASPPTEVGIMEADPSEVWSEELTWLDPPTVRHHFHWDSTVDHSDRPLEASVSYHYVTFGHILSRYFLSLLIPLKCLDEQLKQNHNLF